jgi:hypothetical protein
LLREWPASQFVAFVTPLAPAETRKPKDCAVGTASAFTGVVRAFGFSPKPRTMVP